MFASSSEKYREEGSVWVLVVLHPRLSSWWTATTLSNYSHTKGPLTKGATYFVSPFGVVSPLTLVAVAILSLPLGRCVHVHCKCCQQCWMVPISFLL